MAEGTTNLFSYHRLQALAAGAAGILVVNCLTYQLVVRAARSPLGYVGLALSIGLWLTFYLLFVALSMSMLGSPEAKLKGRDWLALVSTFSVFGILSLAMWILVYHAIRKKSGTVYAGPVFWIWMWLCGYLYATLQSKLQMSRKAAAERTSTEVGDGA